MYSYNLKRSYKTLYAQEEKEEPAIQQVVSEGEGEEEGETLTQVTIP